MNRATGNIPGYAYGSETIPPSHISIGELDELKVTVGWTDDDSIFLRLAGEVLEDQTEEIVGHWRSGIIASIPNLARHSQTPEGHDIPEYAANSGKRFEQWIMDTCLRPYDQEWLDYQMEIARRHTSAMKNKIDGVRSTPFVPLRDIVAFIAVINDTIRTYLASKGHSAGDVDKMHRAWSKSLQLQTALWSKVYVDMSQGSGEW